MGGKCLLVSHDAKFDTPRLMRAIEMCNLNTLITNIIYGTCESLTIFKNKFPERKGTGSFTLSTVAKDLLKVEGNFHHPLFDIIILKALCNTFFKVEFLKNNLQTLSKLRDSYKKNPNIELHIPLLSELEGILSKLMIKKLAGNSITYNNLRNIFKSKGKDAFLKYLSEKVDGKPRLPSRKDILSVLILKIMIYKSIYMYISKKLASYTCTQI